MRYMYIHLLPALALVALRVIRFATRPRHVFTPGALIIYRRGVNLPAAAAVDACSSVSNGEKKKRERGNIRIPGHPRAFVPDNPAANPRIRESRALRERNMNARRWIGEGGGSADDSILEFTLGDTPRRRDELDPRSSQAANCEESPFSLSLSLSLDKTVRSDA